MVPYLSKSRGNRVTRNDTVTLESPKCGKINENIVV
jgi:hypothetical protein